MKFIYHRKGFDAKPLALISVLTASVENGDNWKAVSRFRETTVLRRHMSAAERQQKDESHKKRNPGRRAAFLEERDLRDLVHEIDAIIWQADPITFQFSFVSQRAETILGYPVEKWLVEPNFWIEHIHPEDRDRALTLCRSATEKGEDHEFDYRALAADGRVVWLRDIVRVIKDDKGRPRQLRGVMTDITDRKQMEALLAGEKNILEMIAAGTHLSAILETLVRLIEEQSPAMLGSILVLGKDEKTLRLGAAPSLPESYNRAIDGLAIGPNAGCCGTAAYRKEPVIVSDVVGDPLWTNHRALALEHGLRACWSTPIFSKDHSVLGTLAMYYREPRSPNKNDLALIQTASHIAGIAIERKRAEEQVLRQMESLRALYAVSATTSQSLDLEVVLNRSLETILGVLKFDAGRIFLFDESGQQLSVRAQRGIRDETAQILPYKVGEGIVGRVAESGECLVFEDIRTDPEFHRQASRKKTLKAGFQALGNFPIKAKERTLGSLDLCSYEEHRFSRDEIQLIGSIAHQIGTAVEHAKLFKETRINMDRIRALHEISTSITSTLDTRIVLDLLLDKLDLLVPYATAAVRLFNNQTEELEPAAWRQVDKEDWRKYLQKSEGGVSKVVFQAKKPLIVGNLQTDARVRDHGFFHKHGLTSYVGVPMIAKGDVIGVLAFCTAEEREFTSEEIKFLTTLASQAAIAIYHSRLHERITIQAAALEASNKLLRDRTRQQTVVGHLAHLALAKSDLSELLTEAVTLVSQTLETQYAKVLELLPGGQSFILRAGVGWKQGYVGQANVGTGPDSQAGYTLISNGPVIVEDIRTETRFNGPPLLHDHGVVSGMSVVIQGNEGPFGVLGAHTDRRRKFSDNDVQFLQSIASVLAAAIERRHLESQVAEISEQERRRLGQDLHDDLGQQLTGIAFLSKVLAQKLAAKSLPEAIDAAEIVNLTNKAINQTRNLARVLYPVQLEADGLASALADLAASTQQRLNISCQFKSGRRILINDNSSAIQLYRIAEEAVNNAVKHSKARHVLIGLCKAGGRIILVVSDDGIGISHPIPANEGIGLHIMRYRAARIHGSLDIRRGKRAGTVVTCSFDETSGPPAETNDSRKTRL